MSRDRSSPLSVTNARKSSSSSRRDICTLHHLGEMRLQLALLGFQFFDPGPQGGDGDQQVKDAFLEVVVDAHLLLLFLLGHLTLLPARSSRWKSATGSPHRSHRSPSLRW